MKQMIDGVEHSFFKWVHIDVIYGPPVYHCLVSLNTAMSFVIANKGSSSKFLTAWKNATEEKGDCFFDEYSGDLCIIYIVDDPKAN